MAPDETSQDSTVIGDDLVEALGFEPVRTVVDSDEASVSIGQDGALEVDAVEVGDLDGDAVEVGDLDGDAVDGLDDTPHNADPVVTGADKALPDAGGEVANELGTVEESVEDDVDVLIDLSEGTEASVVEARASAGDTVSVGDAEADAEGTTIDLDTGPDDLELADLESADVDDDELSETVDEAVDEPVEETVEPARGYLDDFDRGVDETVGNDTALEEIVVETDTSNLLEPEPQPELAPSPAPASRRIPLVGSRRHQLRARKSRRVVRHIDPWSVLTFSVLFHLCFFAAMLLASVLVWNAAIAAGTVENIENFIRELGDYETFEIHSDVVFRAAVLMAGILTLASSVLVVLLTVVFNLISDLVGGIRVTVIEEETVRVAAQTQQKSK